LSYQWLAVAGAFDENQAKQRVFYALDVMLNGRNILDPDIWGMPINIFMFNYIIIYRSINSYIKATQIPRVWTTCGAAASNSVATLAKSGLEQI
jgi:hypothetical protein